MKPMAKLMNATLDIGMHVARLIYVGPNRSSVERCIDCAVLLSTRDIRICRSPFTGRVYDSMFIVKYASAKNR